MTQKIDMETPEVVAYELDEELDTELVEQFHSDLRKAIADSDSVRVFVDVRNMDKIEPGAIIEDLKLTPEYLTEIDRFAIVGDERWQEVLTTVTDKISKGEARFFEPDHLDEAQAWVKTHA